MDLKWNDDPFDWAVFGILVFLWFTAVLVDQMMNVLFSYLFVGALIVLITSAIHSIEKREIRFYWKYMPIWPIFFIVKSRSLNEWVKRPGIR